MISVITVNFNSYDFLELLWESLDRYSTQPFELVVVDNSTNKRKFDRPNVGVYPMPVNVGHGEGLNIGSRIATGEFTLFLDVDCHIRHHGWDELFLKKIDGFDVLAGKGVPEKPIRPACLFCKREIAQKYDWRSTPGYQGHRITPSGYDVAIAAYHQMLKDQLKIELLEAIHPYLTGNGECFMVDTVPTVYHHWHGTHIRERQIDFPNLNLEEEKRRLFQIISWRSL